MYCHDAEEHQNFIFNLEADTLLGRRESVRDVGGFDEATSLEKLVNNLERDINEWSHLKQLDSPHWFKQNWIVSLRKCRRII